MGIFDFLKSEKQNPKASAPAPAPSDKMQRHNITGVSHYEANLLKLAIKNPAYAFTQKDILARKLCCQNIFEYTFAPKRTALIPEPDNPQDPNAIKVVIDGQHVGYIKSGSCTRVLNLIKENRIAGIESRISGGKYQNLWAEGNQIQQHEKGSKKYHVEILIYEK